MNTERGTVVGEIQGAAVRFYAYLHHITFNMLMHCVYVDACVGKDHVVSDSCTSQRGREFDCQQLWLDADE